MASCRVRKHCVPSIRSSRPSHAPIAAMSKQKVSLAHRSGVGSAVSDRTPANANERCRIPTEASSTGAHAPQDRQTTLRHTAGCCMGSCPRWKRQAVPRCEWVSASFRPHGVAPEIERRGSTARGMCVNPSTAADRIVFNALFPHEFRAIQIAPIENRRCLEYRLDHIEIWHTKLLPFRDDRQRICAVQRIHRRFDVAQARGISVNPFRFGHRNRVISRDCCTQRPKPLDQHATSSGTHVIGIGLESQTPDREVSALKVGAKTRDDLVEQYVLLTFVCLVDRVQHPEIDLILACRIDECIDVLWEAGPAISTARIEKVKSDRSEEHTSELQS